MRALFALAVATVTLAIVPAAGASSSQTVADFWTGTWPAFLMENGKVTDPLGTLKWRQIRHEEGVAMLGTNFGGRIFEGCPTDPSTLFFRGSYVEGGDLVACTTSADGKTIVGRFNGREDFRSGSFTVSIIRDDDKRIFAGKYFEDEGIVTDWCGSLERRTATAVLPPLASPDLVAPSARALASTGRAGTIVRLRFRVGEDATVRVTVRHGSRIVGRTVVSAHPGLAFGAWRAPKRLTGALRFTVVAVDAAGNASPASAASLRLT